jgi:hypothetical protein
MSYIFKLFENEVTKALFVMRFRTRLFRAATLASSMNLSTPLSILIYPPNSECPYSLLISGRADKSLTMKVTGVHLIKTIGIYTLKTKRFMR